MLQFACKITSKSKISVVLLALVFTSCGNDRADAAQKTEQSQKDTIVAETVVPQETIKRENVLPNEHLTEQLKPIQENFKRINAIEKWTSTSKKDLEESTEGGEADYCYVDGKLEKVVMRQFGETFQRINEYYLMNGQVSFVFEKHYTYNRPVYWDSTAMEQNNDNQAWDIGKSEITETRSFFEQGKLIHQLCDDCGKFPKNYLLEEQRRIQNEFNKLLPAPETDK